MRSVWSDGVEMPSFEKLNESKKTDVLVIGGGIAGILTAYFLHKKKIPYILVEKDRICSGTTCDTTAKLTLSHSLIYDRLIKECGIEIARMYLEANKAALDKYAELCRDIDCNYEIKDNYVYSLDDPRKIEREVDALNKLGCKAELATDLPLPIKTAGAVKCPSQAQFHPLKFLAEIAKDLNIYENTFVKNIEGKRAFTDSCTIDAERIVVATHFPFIDRYGAYFIKMYQHRSYVLALEGARDVDGMYVDEGLTGLSFRNYGDMLLFGGGGHRTGKNGGGYDELRRLAKRFYPDSKEKYHWAAQDCMSLGGTPYIGRYSGFASDLYVATGFNKWGMSSSMVSAMILSDMLSEKENPFEAAFSPSGNIFKPQLAVNLFETATNLIRPTAPRCSHLGCALKWNKAEHSWDCACHGSRFSESGEILDNPANKKPKL